MVYSTRNLSLTIWKLGHPEQWAKNLIIVFHDVFLYMRIEYKGEELLCAWMLYYDMVRNLKEPHKL
jgi:hypothetical protein